MILLLPFSFCFPNQHRSKTSLATMYAASSLKLSQPFVAVGPEDEFFNSNNELTFFSSRQPDVENGGDDDESDDPFGIGRSAVIAYTEDEEEAVNAADHEEEDPQTHDDEDKVKAKTVSFSDDIETDDESEPFLDAPNIVSLERMRDNVFFTFPDWRRRVSAYYLLIILAAMIASSGVAGDSPATVIGAMIVAPLMTPILGIVLSIVTRDCKNLCVSISLVFSGALIAVGIGLAFGMFLDDDQIRRENNSQIASRVLPRLTDLIAALATGAVGSIAMVREDIAGSLPGVAIAISLVPPLNVVGLTLSTGEWDDAAGAGVLFLTNLCAILFVGTCTLSVYRGNYAAKDSRGICNHICSCSVSFCLSLMMFILLLLVAVPLGGVSYYLRYTVDIEHCVEDELNAILKPYLYEVSVVDAYFSLERNDFVAEAAVVGEEKTFTDPVPISEGVLSGSVGDQILNVCDIDRLEVTYVPVQEFVFN